MFRHVEEARNATENCRQWLNGGCNRPKCPQRHDDTVNMVLSDNKITKKAFLLYLSAVC